LYASNQCSFSNKLVPLATGLSLIRDNSTVNVSTPLKLLGFLPTDTVLNMSSYNLSINSTVYQPSLISLTSSIPLSMSINLPTYTNPLTTAS
jgi:hypothetical protein